MAESAPQPKPPAQPETLYPGSGLNPVQIVRDETDETEPDPLAGLGQEDKRLVKAHVGYKEVTFVEREFKVRGDYLKKWRILRERGLPVVPTLRISERGSILMTNLKADGSELYGKAKRFKFKEKLGYQLTDIDRVFIKVMQTQRAEIHQAVQDLAHLATEQGILLPSDDPFELIVHPDGRWELIIIDLSWVGIDTNDDLDYFNRRSVENRFKDVERLHRGLEGKTSPLHFVKNSFLGAVDLLQTGGQPTELKS